MYVWLLKTDYEIKICRLNSVSKLRAYEAPYLSLGALRAEKLITEIILWVRGKRVCDETKVDKF